MQSNNFFLFSFFGKSKSTAGMATFGHLFCSASPSSSCDVLKDLAFPILNSYSTHHLTRLNYLSSLLISFSKSKSSLSSFMCLSSCFSTYSFCFFCIFPPFFSTHMVGSTSISNASPRYKTKGLIFIGIFGFSFYQPIIRMS